MKKKIIFALLISIISFPVFSQQLPYGTCGIVNVYDNAGNRTMRVYFCNNGGPYPGAANLSSSEVMESQPVDALYPNPTTGKFSVTFSKSLQKAKISITDVNGKALKQFNANGTKVDFDLSSFAAGVYFIKIEENEKVISKKVIKL